MPLSETEQTQAADISRRFGGLSWRVRNNYPAYIAFALAVVIAGWIATFATILSERQTRQDLDRQSALELVSALEAHTTNVLSYADTYLKAVRHGYLGHGGVDGLQSVLNTAPPNPAILSHVTVLDRTGRPLYVSSGTKIKPNITASDRDYFQFLKASTGDPVYISRPSYGRNSGLLTIRVARRIEFRPGQFDGVIFTAIEPKILTDPFQSLNLGRNSAAGLIGLDQEVRAWSESGHFQTNLDASGWAIWQALETEPRGMVTQLATGDGITRDLAYLRLADYPLIAVIGVAAIDMIDATSHYTWSAIAMATLVTLIIAVLTWSILRDIRLMRALEDEIAVRRRAESEAVHATEIKTAFLATMSHEIRTPINAILGLFELIEQADVPERQKRQSRAGQAAATALFKQLTNVLDASRLEAKSLDLSLRTEPVAPMIAALSQLLEATIKNSGKPITSSFCIEADVPETLIMDRRRVEQIVLNFIDNAVKFTESGRIELRAAVLVNNGTRELCISVHDTGAGMSGSDQDRLFKRFSQLDSAITRNVGGAGLGLSICKDLAKLMHARLTVDSIQDEGTQFSLMLMMEELSLNST